MHLLAILAQGGVEAQGGLYRVLCQPCFMWHRTMFHVETQNHAGLGKDTGAVWGGTGPGEFLLPNVRIHAHWGKPCQEIP